MGKYKKNGRILTTNDKAIISALLNSGYKPVENAKPAQTDETPAISRKAKRGE